MVDRGENISEGREGGEVGGVERGKSKPGGLLSKLAKKTKRAVTHAAMVGLPLLPIATSCALKPSGQEGEFCAYVDADQRPLDKYFSNYDMRDVKPLSPEQRGKSLEIKKLSVDFLSDFLENRVEVLTGQKLNLNNVVEYEEKSKYYEPVQAIKSRIEIGFKKDLSAFLRYREIFRAILHMRIPI